MFVTAIGRAEKAMRFGDCYRLIPSLLLALLGPLEPEVELLLALDWNIANASQWPPSNLERTRKCAA